MMKLTWTDIEAHRNAATPQQWCRMQAYFRDGKSFGEIAAEEGKAAKDPLRAKTSMVLAIGRGATAVLNSMLQRPVRIPTEKAFAASIPDRGEPPLPDAPPPEAQVHILQAIVRGTRVKGDRHEAGRVEKIEGDMAVVVWDRGFKTFAPLAHLTPLAP